MPENTEAAVAALQADMRSFQATLTEVKSMMARVLSLSESVALLQERHNQQQLEMGRAFKSLENTEQSLVGLRDAFVKEFKELENKVETHKAETEAWKNQAKGFAKAAVIAWMLFGGAAVAAITWAGSEAIHIRDGVQQLKGAVGVLTKQGEESGKAKGTSSQTKSD